MDVDYNMEGNLASFYDILIPGNSNFPRIISTMGFPHPGLSGNRARNDQQQELNVELLITP